MNKKCSLPLVMVGTLGYTDLAMYLLNSPAILILQHYVATVSIFYNKCSINF